MSVETDNDDEMSILKRRFVIVAWPPDLPEIVFPKGWQLFPHSIWHFPVEDEKCTRCGFTVKWIIWEEEFEEWNERIREEIGYQLKAQSEKCLCPSHPIAWM